MDWTAWTITCLDDGPTITGDDDQTVDTFEQVSLSVLATEPNDPDPVASYAWTAPADIILIDGDTATPSFTAPFVAPGDPPRIIPLEVITADAANNGLNSAYLTASSTGGPGLTPVNTDGTDAVDMLDLDTDNDSVFDIVESGLGLNDGNNNGRTDDSVGTNGLDNSANAESSDDYSDVNGLSHDGAIFSLRDTDGDTDDDGAGAAPTAVDFDWRDNVGSDRSDAPGTLGDAVHTIIDGIRLGALIDGDPATLASANADGDGADDDGVTIPALTQGQTATITADVTGAGGFLQGWIDFDGSGTFETGEQIATDLQDDGADDDVITFDVDVPVAATTEQTKCHRRPPSQ